MVSIKDIFQDLVSFAVPLNINVIRVKSDKNTLFEGHDEGKRVIMKATTNEPVDGLDKNFGMSNLKILRGYLDTFKKLANTEELAKKLKIDIALNSKNKDVPTDVVFNLSGQASANYRLMSYDNAPAQPTMTQQIQYDIEVKQPSRNKIQEFSSFAGILSEVEKNFSVKVINKQLKFFIGDENSSNSKVEFVFADDVQAKLTSALYWECHHFLAIMNLADSADTTIKISNVGLIQIIVNTGLLTYEFLLPGSNS